MKRGHFSSIDALTAAMCTLSLWNAAAFAQVRTYEVRWTNTAPTMDGVVSAGEWAAAAPAAGNWEELRQPETDMDTANNRFQMMWDANGLYLLYQVNQTIWLPAPTDNLNPDINFSGDSLNIYFDPNTDDEPNFQTVPDSMVDGYQIAFDQFEGSLISTNANRMGVGVFTEAHFDTAFGDQANWNRGGTQVGGAAMQDIIIAQNNGATGGVTELVIPWSNFNADVTPPPADYNRNSATDTADYALWRDTSGQGVTNPGDGADGDLSGTVDNADYALWRTNYGAAGEPGTTGLYHAFAPANNDTWFYQIGQITDADPDNYLPVYSYTSNDPPIASFALHPHAEITFVGRPASGASAGVPEPTTVALFGLAAASLAAVVRRRA
jgi:hypothetical protein